MANCCYTYINNQFAPTKNNSSDWSFIQVVQAAIKALDDKKRAVRQVAVRCRQTWCVHFAGYTFINFEINNFLAFWTSVQLMQAILCLRESLSVVSRSWEAACCLVGDPVGSQWEYMYWYACFNRLVFQLEIWVLQCLSSLFTFLYIQD